MCENKVVELLYCFFWCITQTYMNNISDVKMQNGIQVAVSDNGFQIGVNVKCLMFKLNSLK